MSMSRRALPRNAGAPAPGMLQGWSRAGGAAAGHAGASLTAGRGVGAKEGRARPAMGRVTPTPERGPRGGGGGVRKVEFCRREWREWAPRSGRGWAWGRREVAGEARLAWPWALRCPRGGGGERGRSRGGAGL